MLNQHIPPATEPRLYEVTRQNDVIVLTLGPDTYRSTVYLSEEQAFELVHEIVKSTAWVENMATLIASTDLLAEIDGEIDAVGEERVGMIASTDEHGTPWDEPRVASAFDQDWEVSV